jgi:probable addiction module antidote protein
VDVSRVETQRDTKIKLRRWDVTRYLNSDEEIVGYLNAVLDEDDQELLLAALGDVARAKGMTHVSRETGLGRESLYKALSEQGNPEFATVQKVLRSLGLRLRVSS